jgi:3-hydroxyacyl-CoA dehydrogenase
LEPVRTTSTSERTLKSVLAVGDFTGRDVDFRYGANGRTAIRDPEIEALVVVETERKGIRRRQLPPEEICQRAHEPANEAPILPRGSPSGPRHRRGLDQRPQGFLAHRGGPTFWADASSLDQLLSEIERFAKDDPRTWQPAPLIVALAASGDTMNS